MFLFLIPLLLGFTFNAVSALTTAFSRRWGKRRGSLVTAILRNVLGIPVWAIGFLLAARAPSPGLFAKTIVIDAVGIILIALGGVIIVVALLAIRSRAAVPATTDPLIRSGLYFHVRHPIHSGTILEFAGLFLLHPTQTIALACILGTLWVLVQTKLEEYDLLQRLPAYREYMKQVPRFYPRRRKK
jgi:protein-S-isoprenylcysteine O-methyltransferase Ste14